MSEGRMKCRQISSKLVGSNVVNFRLEDGTLFKIYVELNRVGVAIDRQAPDGTPIYNFNISTRVELETKDKTYYAPLPCLTTQSAGKKSAEQIKYTS